MAITIPHEYGYVLLAATSAFWVNLYHTALTGRARKASKQEYPISYASNDVAQKDPKAYKFNCAQRAHANFSENLVPVVGELLIAGLRHPVLAAGLGATWSVGRVLYAYGYVNSGPEGRRFGATVAGIPMLLLKALSAYTAFTFVRELF